MQNVLSVNDLVIGFNTQKGMARAVDGVSFALPAGQIFGLVGESGCGKSITALSLLQLLPQPPAQILAGSAIFNGHNLLTLNAAEINKIRGASIGMVFQEPMTSLNPVFTVGEQVAEPLRLHAGLSPRAAKQEAVRLLEQVGITNASARAKAYPHELSGGMRQRVMIAMATGCNPQLLIADEPTTALDASLQGQILDLLQLSQKKSGSAMLLITHDLNIVAGYASNMAVMYSGKIVESGPVKTVLTNPAHPYTKGLINSRPRFNPGQRYQRLPAIAGTVPLPLNRPSGCAFSNRCPNATEHCTIKMPQLKTIAPNHQSRCWL
ncbi:ABC transporter ATP-binding protein [Desulfovibrio sp. OttesenSCG-928-F07]|nr:ABC transporter ATP-binding protein [Desulfovibrio sp. OttesenSCG-928-F07]